MGTLRNATSGSELRHMMEGYLSSSHLTGRRLAGAYRLLTYWEDSATECPVPASRISTDRKSTRLNSSHRTISYAVFCLIKKIHTRPIRIGRTSITVAVQVVVERLGQTGTKETVRMTQAAAANVAVEADDRPTPITTP